MLFNAKVLVSSSINVQKTNKQKKKIRQNKVYTIQDNLENMVARSAEFYTRDRLI